MQAAGAPFGLASGLVSLERFDSEEPVVRRHRLPVCSCDVASRATENDRKKDRNQNSSPHYRQVLLARFAESRAHRFRLGMKSATINGEVRVARAGSAAGLGRWEMSNDDWSSREIDEGGPADREMDRLRRLYRNHAETLSTLASSAPTRGLAKKYRELIGDVNRAIVGLDDPGAIVSMSSDERPILADPPEPASPSAPPPAAARPPVPSSSGVKLDGQGEPYVMEVEEDNSLTRIVIILSLAIVLIVVLALFVWKFGSDSRAETKEISKPAAAVGVPDKPAAAQKVPAITASPEAQDFGVVYKSTRVAKTFEVFNNTDDDVTIEIERSNCRCLWFDYPNGRVIPVGGQLEISVAVDGSRASAGVLSETVVISTIEPPRVATEVIVSAEIR